MNELMDFSVLDGKITGLSPVDATGTLSDSGSGTWAPTDPMFTPYKFTGTFSGTTASGTWTYSLPAPQAGSASGTWSAKLQAP